jgi:hypothetical protein
LSTFIDFFNPPFFKGGQEDFTASKIPSNSPLEKGRRMVTEQKFRIFV